MSKYAKRTDGNHKKVKAELEAAMPGASVFRLDPVVPDEASVFDAAGMGKGFPDLVMGAFERNWLIELKNPEQASSRRRLTAAQVAFHENWHGDVITVCSGIEVYAHIARVFYKEGKA